ncbi:MAG: hypothetical protein WCG75_11905 [Armatimonadota bacterium]
MNEDQYQTLLKRANQLQVIRGHGDPDVKFTDWVKETHPDEYEDAVALEEELIRRVLERRRLREEAQRAEPESQG